MHPIEKYRLEHGITYHNLAKLLGFKSRSTVFQHVSGTRGLTAEAALRYHRILGIPLPELRPDLWPPEEEKREGS